MHPLDIFKFCPKCGGNNFLENTFNSKRCKDCGFTYYKSAPAAVAGIILNNKGELLVSRREIEPAKGTLDLIGGFVDIGETAEEAMIRETKEEANIDIKINKFLFSTPDRYVYSGLDVRPLILVFKCDIINMETINADNSELSGLEFVDINKLNPDEFGLPGIKNVIIELKKNS